MFASRMRSPSLPTRPILTSALDAHRRLLDPDLLVEGVALRLQVADGGSVPTDTAASARAQPPALGELREL
eukprot:15237203-Alexandrium_andersonii.AAC.1